MWRELLCSQQCAEYWVGALVESVNKVASGAQAVTWVVGRDCDILGGRLVSESEQAGREQWLDHWAERIHRSGWALIVLPLLQVGRGLGFLVSQVLLLVQPGLGGLIDVADIDRYVAFLEDPLAIEELIERVEQKAECDD